MPRTLTEDIVTLAPRLPARDLTSLRGDLAMPCECVAGECCCGIEAASSSTSLMARVAHLHPALGLLDGRLVAVDEDTQNRSEELPRSVHGPAAASACARVEGRLDCGGDPGLGLPAVETAHEDAGARSAIPAVEEIH